MKKLLIQFIIRLALVAIGIAGILVTVISASFMGGWVAFLYFTVQSNITIILMEAFFAFDALRQMLGKKSLSNHVLYLIKYVFTVAITITFLVFAFVLAPTLGADYLLSYGNFSLHFIVPILALVDFFIFNHDIKLNKVNCLWGLGMPIYYLIFFFIGIPFNLKYIGNDPAPYFFLNFEKLTWFSFTSNGPGVFYWILILTGAITGLCYLFYLFIWLIQKYSKKEK